MMFKKKLPQSSGFTLIETVVAAVILITVLMASVTASRAVKEAAAFSEDRLQMTALADESITALRLLKDGLKRQGLSFGHANGVNLAAGVNDISTYGTLVSNQQVLAGCSGSTCPAAEVSGPMTLNWCTSSNGCKDRPVGLGGVDAVSSVGIDNQGAQNCSGSSCLVSQIFTSMSALYGFESDLIAIRRTSFSADAADNRAVYDGTSLRNAAPATTVFSSQQDDYSFYARQIEITRLGNCVGGSGGSCSVDPLFYQDSGTGVGAPNATLRNATYKVTVKMTNFYNPQSKLHKTVILTDW